MTGKTHIVAGLIAGLAMTQFIPDNDLVIVGACVLGSLAPDIDHPHSTINGIIPFFRWTHLITGHRGILHGLFIPIYLIAIIWLDQPITWIMKIVSTVSGSELIAPNWSYIFLPALGVGWLTHILLDALTPRGVPLLYPLKKPIRLLPKLFSPSTGSFFEFLILLCLLAVLILEGLFIVQTG